MKGSIFNWDYAWGSIQTKDQRGVSGLDVASLCCERALSGSSIYCYFLFFSFKFQSSQRCFKMQLQFAVMESSLKMADTSGWAASYEWRANPRWQLLEIKRVNSLNAQSQSVGVGLTMQLLCDSCRRDRITGMTREMEFLWHLSLFFFFFNAALVQQHYERKSCLPI